MSNFKEDLNKVKAFVFDVDGVFTDGSVYCMADGEQMRAMNTKDGFAIRFAQKQGYPIGIISAGKANVGVVKRLQFLDITDLYMGSFEKTEALQQFVKKYNFSLDQILYMGDDIPDYPVLRMVGVPTCPGDAAVEVKQVSKYISHLNGGQGCVRDVIEQVLRAQGKWVDLTAEKIEIL
ncbi:MAG TPA: 3-deoxy-D-manno-octulosonate 8-phosphate phosphatase [Marinilabiliales bacterium]|jgi:3-deoxy-D-manno-octulosonate 8-phosphate phosphatase (KDO 8-P phosphatase)|nr:MAG: 3-deoxy-D-manno-octulosonate 8-phosphate phosphatase [Bacteroidetes bacterium GWA2_40_14]OFX58753.1 MAG: 3-deoxy-D-manno-octulosonate 8-phosphate phosphatase [Bacteroidetes bacterium GWC2_40_13]OFX73417.1 MAG: 3-deoxy-D-manno-octulosonate 8-phosphate phosphatase [Bacteroidetes bacterium GWD2_40_43]OFX94767.1 MAG: 3-deoxy-D-manno-octulosonate 8-phosphate phosphatase [Bacteroidetes bacterium GWE2_40_63]OFY24703.1 MAG: 3-deoxy-D-manno-octulosonate 8-phosphate phosphatase [Bacteroidetes bac